MSTTQKMHAIIKEKKRETVFSIFHYTPHNNVYQGLCNTGSTYGIHVITIGELLEITIIRR